MVPIIFNSVVLPPPEVPRIHINSLSWIDRLTPIHHGSLPEIIKTLTSKSSDSLNTQKISFMHISKDNEFFSRLVKWNISNFLVNVRDRF